ncbi:MAG: tRNA (adenosine(37)-N6)-dimethylallyltransferase MiaA [Clostridia bacterium]|nr:tRNA (adenosine(37)-N6)-dimethylallyltransferase MiaA [Clostridia bacterium]
MSDKPKIAAVVGCTASGKTSLSIGLCKRLGGEIVSCDSMQIYRGMDVGTAKPDEAERDGVPHHLIDVADPSDPAGYSCADYVRDARAAVEDILSRGKLPILCGGTGLYLDAFLRGGTFAVTETDPALRQSLADYAAREGNGALHARLCAVDPESAAAIHPNNVKRVIRALEICMTTGRKKSDLDRESREEECPYDARVIGLRYHDRSILYGRIDRRVDMMLDAGLVDETRRLRDAGVFDVCSTAAQAIGYKELFPYLDGQASLAEVTETLKIATRHYAKRQLTWFGAKEYVEWVDMDDPDGAGKLRSFGEIVNIMENIILRP